MCDDAAAEAMAEGSGQYRPGSASGWLRTIKAQAQRVAAEAQAMSVHGDSGAWRTWAYGLSYMGLRSCACWTAVLGDGCQPSRRTACPGSSVSTCCHEHLKQRGDSSCFTQTRSAPPRAA